MKKILCVCILMLVFATGCASKTDSDSGKQQSETDKSEFRYEINGVAVIPGESVADAVGSFGEPIKYNEAASCYYEGMDKQYGYDGFEIRTYPDGDDDIIQDICITGEEYKTLEGVGIGSSLADVLKQYGEGYTLVGKMYKYYVDDVRYKYFFIMDDAVKYFGYAIDAMN